jgi:hypothetical protein
MKHTELWHKPRPSWSCAALTNSLTPDFFIEKSHDADGTTNDFCLCCRETLHPNQQAQDIRIWHLRKAHNLDKDECGKKCFSKEQFCLHLATGHSFCVEAVKDFMESCRVEARAPALMTEFMPPK